MNIGWSTLNECNSTKNIKNRLVLTPLYQAYSELELCNWNHQNPIYGLKVMGNVSGIYICIVFALSLLTQSVNPGLRMHSILCVFFTFGCLLVVRRVYPPSMVGGLAAEVELADTHFWISEDSTKTIHFNVSQFCFGNIFTAICRKVKVLFDL